MKVRTSALVGLIAAGLALTGSLASALPAFAGSPASVGKVAASFTPWLLSSPAAQQVHQLAPCGDLMYAVGRISAVGQGTSTYSRGNAFSFSQTTGAMTAFDPHANSDVLAIAFSPDCSVAYLGGKFTAIDGQSSSHIVAVDTATGALIPTFKATVSTRVDTIVYTPQGLIIGGQFTKVSRVPRSYLASLDPKTGAVTPYVDIPFSGSYGTSTTHVYRAQLSHTGTRLLIEGAFTSIAGQPRQQVAMFDLGGPTVTLDNWYAPEYNAPCQVVQAWYARNGAWSPDDSTVYIADTGGYPLNFPPLAPALTGGMCDAETAFPSDSTTVTHKWISYTGCDSSFAIVADAGQVYVGGHFRWLDNSNGCNAAGPGSLPRPGLASLDPTTGAATSWNPTRSLGVGADTMVLTPAGLWVGSDTWKTGLAQNCAHTGNHGGICFLPYPTGD